MTGHAVPPDTSSDWANACQIQVRFMQHSRSVLACTDGVIEATNPQGKEWGLDGLQTALSGCDPRSAEDTEDSIFAALDEYTGRVQTDDATVVALHVG